jgi:HAMP domain-containing protein
VARNAAYSERAWQDVERAIGKQMVVQASIAAEFVAAAERAGMSPAQINERLRAITRRSTIDEFWVTDPRGHAYLHSEPGIDFTFSPDPQEQRQASAFFPLLTGRRDVVIQRTLRREVDDRIFKYVGVSGVDRPRIVQVGYEAIYLAALRRQVGLVELVEETASAPGVETVRVVNKRLGTQVFRDSDGSSEDADLSGEEAAALEAAERSGEPVSFEQGEVLAVAAPIVSDDGETSGAALVDLSLARVNEALSDGVLIAIAIGLGVLALALGAAVAGARRIAGPVTELTDAAKAVEEEQYEPGSLDAVAGRRDEIGRLAQVFDRMAREVRAREQRLRREIKKLSVQIDQGKRARHVAEITETDYFRDLQKRGEELRGQSTREDAEGERRG